MNKLPNLNQEIKAQKLTLEEKAALRATILSYMTEYPRVQNKPLKSFWLLQHRTWGVSLVFALILVVSVSSVSYAAEYSLPGETLYGLKINVTEPLRATLQTTTEKQARWESALVERRLAEAQLLADSGELHNGKEQEIIQLINNQTTKARASVHQVGTVDTLQAAILNARLEASLSAHRQLLSDNNDDQAVKIGSNLQQSLELQASTTRALGTELEADWQDQDDKENARTDLQASTKKLQNRLQQDSQELEKNIQQNPSNKKVHDNIKRKITEAQQLIVPNNLANTTSTKSQSLTNLQKALKLEQEIKLINQAKNKNDRSILKSIYSDDDYNDRSSDNEKSKDKNNESGD